MCISFVTVCYHLNKGSDADSILNQVSLSLIYKVIPVYTQGHSELGYHESPLAKTHTRGTKQRASILLSFYKSTF